MPQKEPPTLNEIRAEQCRRSLYFFVQEFWGLLVPETPVWNWHIKYICDELQDIGFRAIARKPFEYPVFLLNIPPGTSKTTVSTILFPAWLWANDPSIRILTASYAADLSLDQSGKSKDVITSEKYKAYFPYVIIKDDTSAKGRFRTTKNGVRITSSVGGAATGEHAHIIILDDAQSAGDANSEAKRENTNAWFDSTPQTRTVNAKNTPVLVIQQRLHEKDLTAHILSRGIKVKHLCFPAEESDAILPKEMAAYYKDGLFDPVRLDREILEGKRTGMGSAIYNAQMNQKPGSDGGSIIKKAWLNKITAHQWAQFSKDNSGYVVDFYMDTAYTENTKNDPSAIVACTKIDGLLYVLHASDFHMELPQLLKHIAIVTADNGYTSRSKIKVEPKASGKDVVNMMKRGDLNVIEFETPTTSKIERLNSIAPKVEASKVVIIEGAWNDKFEEQVCTDYPMHDDMRDCFIMAVKDKLIDRASYGQYFINGKQF